MQRGIIYIFINKAMPNIIKIGRTENDDIKERCAQLYRGLTSVPVPFEIYYAAYVFDTEKVEKALHEGFAENRINPKREFFNINPERVIAMLQMVDPEPIYLEKENKTEIKEYQEETETSKKLTASFRYSMVGIKEGDYITFLRDKNIKVKVLTKNPSTNKLGNWVEYKGKIYSMSSLATKLLKFKYGVSGTLYWLYNEKKLSDLREEKEAKYSSD